jgi:hypothetical protein
MKKQEQNVLRRIRKRAARGEKRVVVTIRNGLASSVWGFDEYLDHIALAKQVKPWRGNQAKTKTPDPFGAIDAAPPHPLTRASMYDMDLE